MFQQRLKLIVLILSALFILGSCGGSGGGHGHGHGKPCPTDPEPLPLGGLNLIVDGTEDGSIPASLKTTLAAHTLNLFNKVRADGTSLMMNLGPDITGAEQNKAVLNSGNGDQFLPGKFAVGFADMLIRMKQENDPRYPDYLATYQAIIDEMMTWNKWTTFSSYYYAFALVKFKNAGMLDEVFGATRLEFLETKVTYTTFINTTTWALGVSAANYYAVAYAIAGLREKLGWEPEGLNAKYHIQQAFINHYETKGNNGFQDEYNGSSSAASQRFDRYSALTAAEMVERAYQMGYEDQLDLKYKDYLRQSVRLVLPMIDPRGVGMNYGRSVGPYGDTAVMEILSAAAKLGILKEPEFGKNAELAAYSYVHRIAQRFVNFWYDSELESVNMWVNTEEDRIAGRRNFRGTDSYRGTDRVMGENLSLMQQFMFDNELWNSIGYKNRTPMTDAEMIAWGKQQYPNYYNVTWYVDPTGTPSFNYNSANISIRDGRHVFNLNISPSESYVTTPAYFPIPLAEGVIQATPDMGSSFPLLIPRIAFSGTTYYAPIYAYKNLLVSESGGVVTVTYDIDQVTYWNANPANSGVGTRYKPVTVKTTYNFDTNQHTITRKDEFKAISSDQNIARVQMDYAAPINDFAKVSKVSDFKVEYDSNDLVSYEVLSGFAAENCLVPQNEFTTKKLGATPTGQINGNFSCSDTSGRTITATAPMEFSWRITYKP